MAARRFTKPVDWIVIRSRCEAGDVGLREIARLLGINHNTVRQRARREGWQIPKHRLRNNPRRQAQAMARATTEQTLAPIRDHFAQLGALTRNQLAVLILNAVEELRKLNGLDLLANIQGLGVVTRAASQIHGWDSKHAEGSNPVVNLQLLAMRPAELAVRDAREAEAEQSGEAKAGVSAEECQKVFEREAKVSGEESGRNLGTEQAPEEIRWVSVGGMSGERVRRRAASGKHGGFS